MTVDRRLELALPEILADLGAGPFPDYGDAIVERAARTRQRPAWLFPSRWLGELVPSRSGLIGVVPWRTVLLLALLLIVALAVAVDYIASRPRVPPPFGVAGNGAVAYARSGDIFLGDPLTASSNSIVTDPAYEFGPFFSPDGTRVAFYRQRGAAPSGPIDIVVARADGSDVRVITPKALGEIPWQARWAPDGASIAVVTSPRADASLLIFDALGTAGPVVTDPGMRVDGIAFQPPDGRRILFRGQKGYDIGLFVMNTDGTDMKTVLAPYQSNASQDGDVALVTSGSLGLADLRGPAWSPDGTKIVFRQYDQALGANVMHLFVMNADGSDVRSIGYQVGDTWAAYPGWSPDGSRIAYLRYRESRWRCTVVRLADGVMTETGPDIQDGFMALDWSPDGRRLLLVEHSAAQRVLILDPSGTPWRELPWAPEVPGWWRDQHLPNGAEAGGWQRLAPP
jgi:Tol biopolymer transport system component